ncbi:MAG: ATP synthase F1 subunit gamma [Puniceicoccales bacterium]|jgi:F-type H+-transporting ATPase subunit gamma|nr:ATP synthase F1 subunit gamma [Puniceicoccales bacterium]
MEGIRDIKRRLRAVQGTAKITRAMQLVAASKMRRAQLAATAGRRHALRLEELADKILRMELPTNDLPPLLSRRDVKCRCIVFVATDKGLCGSLNQNTFKLIREKFPQDAKYVAIGKKGGQLLAAAKLQLIGEFSVNDGVPYHMARAVANFLRDAYLCKEIDAVDVVHPLFINTLRQNPVAQRLLPLDGLGENIRAKRDMLPDIGRPLPEDGREITVEPSLARLVETLLESFLQKEMHHILLEAKAAEQSARMVAMKAATDNAEIFAKELLLSYNKARQAAITAEILEIRSADSTP